MIELLWDMTSCGLAFRHQNSDGICCLHVQICPRMCQAIVPLLWY